MFPLVETIRLEAGLFHNLAYHQARFDRSRRECFGSSVVPLSLLTILAPFKNENPKRQKVRLLYAESIEAVEVLSYTPQKVVRLKVVESGIDYHLKSTDRRELTALFNQRGECDNILIVKNGLITDTAYSNIALLQGDQWYTPASPLLEGTAMAALIDSGVLRRRKIRLNELCEYQSLQMINALLPFDSTPQIAILNIIL